MTTWTATGPANIALIKYMGKTTGNLPTNISLSYTLEHLITTVTLSISPTNDHIFQCQPNQTLERTDQQRFLNHLQRLTDHFAHPIRFIVQSENNFPSHCGIASSASSFCALTRCAIQAILALSESDQSITLHEQAMLSRLGSGSSCRSFYSPWATWQHDRVRAIQLPYPSLMHRVILVDGKQKSVSSSIAHQRVSSSPLFEGRPQRATQRYQQLIQALGQQHWPKAYQICKAEFEDMHALFSSATPPFHYLTSVSHQIIDEINGFWQLNNDGPLMTVDAGPNIHLLFRPDQSDLLDALQTRLKHLVWL